MNLRRKIPLAPGAPSGGILTAIGNTPLVRLNQLLPSAHFHVYAKLELMNPGGSGKDRPALGMLLDARERGQITETTTIIESSSGNLGVGLAQACAYLRLRFICVVDSRTTPTHIGILRAFGAEVEVVDTPDPASGDFLPARLNRVRDLQKEISSSFWVNQYSNLSNPGAQYSVFREIHHELGTLDYIFVATSTCGTLRACREYISEHRICTRLIAIDAVGSAIFGNASAGPRLLPGHGAARRPELYREGLETECIHVSDQECVAGCFRLLRAEAIFAGASSGAVISALANMEHRIPANATVVVVLCDRGERYLNTVYSPEWNRQHFGDTFTPWSQNSF